MAVERLTSRRIVRLSRAQNGAVTHRQLLSTGLSRGAIRVRVRRGRLVRLFPGVYAAGDPELMPLVRKSAALLSIGDAAVLSHRSAAAIWGLVEDDDELIAATVVGVNPRPRTGVRIHRVTRLAGADTATRSNLRLTAPARTLIDLAAQAESSELHTAFGEARAKRLVNDRSLRAALARTPLNHRGATIVRAMLRTGETYDRSKAERIMRGLCRQAQLPQPRVNVHLHGFLVDFLWPDVKLILEVDGYGVHGTRQAFEADRRRDQVHVAAGYVVIRVTWRQLQEEPLAVIARVAQALARRAA